MLVRKNTVKLSTVYFIIYFLVHTVWHHMYQLPLMQTPIQPSLQLEHSFILPFYFSLSYIFPHKSNAPCFLRHLLCISCLGNLWDCFTLEIIFFLMSALRIPPSFDISSYAIPSATKHYSFIFSCSSCSFKENPTFTQAFHCDKIRIFFSAFFRL